LDTVSVPDLKSLKYGLQSDFSIGVTRKGDIGFVLCWNYWKTGECTHVQSVQAGS